MFVYNNLFNYFVRNNANKLAILSSGQYVGLEDIFQNNKRSCTAIVISSQAKIYLCPIIVLLLYLIYFQGFLLIY